VEKKKTRRSAIQHLRKILWAMAEMRGLWESPVQRLVVKLFSLYFDSIAGSEKTDYEKMNEFVMGLAQRDLPWFGPISIKTLTSDEKNLKFRLFCFFFFFPSSFPRLEPFRRFVLNCVWWRNLRKENGLNRRVRFLWFLALLWEQIEPQKRREEMRMMVWGLLDIFLGCSVTSIGGNGKVGVYRIWCLIASGLWKRDELLEALMSVIMTEALLDLSVILGAPVSKIQMLKGKLDQRAHTLRLFRRDDKNQSPEITNPPFVLEFSAQKIQKLVVSLILKLFEQLLGVPWCRCSVLEELADLHKLFTQGTIFLPEWRSFLSRIGTVGFSFLQAPSILDI
jgi:hypothetical protein